MAQPLRTKHPDGGNMGADPRELTQADLEAGGLTKQSRGDAIRAKCIDCCGGNSEEVRRCSMLDCSLWPFRMGSDPWRAPMSEERRAEMAERLAKHRRTS